jgi:transcriptional regulator GlxA family with amidase domain
MTSIVMPVYDSVDMLDVTGPYEMFRWAKIDVDLVAENSGPHKFRDAFSFQVDKTFKQAANKYDALWVPGGDPPALSQIINANGAYLNFLREQAEGSKKVRYVCSVCEGAMLLAGAGLLDGYEATTHWYFIACFQKHFPNVKIADGYPRFCLDRTRLTGGGISSGLDEALKLIELLKGTDTAKEVQQSTQYYPDPPVHSDIPNTYECMLELTRPHS